MKILRNILGAFILIAVAGDLSAQTLDDAIRYSLQLNTNTARSAGVSGAFSALGADIFVANINPAGTAEFRKSEFTISMGAPTNSTESRFANNINQEESNTESKLDNLAILFFHDPENFDLKSFNLAVGINKVIDFDEVIYYGGSSNGTIVQRFLERAEGLTPEELDPFEGGPAFDAGAIFNFDGGTSYESDFTTLQEEVFREQAISRSGSVQEVFFNLATNVKNKISLGFTLGLPIVDFNEFKTYREEDAFQTAGFFDELQYSEFLSTSGVGINLKIGAIYKIDPKLRIGAALHSPTWFFLQDEFDTALDYTFTSPEGTESYQGLSPFSDFDYRFRSPWKAIVGIGKIIDLGDLKGFVSAEAEYVDYSAGRFNITANSTDPLDQFAEDDLNNEVSSYLNSGFNFRAGTEIAYQKFRVRLGGALLNDVVTPDLGKYEFDPQISFGLGYRSERYYIDAAYTISSYQYSYSPYRLVDQGREQMVINETSRNRLSITFGSKIGR